MATVDKTIADDIIKGLYPEDGWVKIIEYTTPEGNKAYGAVNRRDDPDRYRPSEYVINPTLYWKAPVLARRYTLTVCGRTEDDLAEAITEACRRIDDGNLCGMDSNSTSAFHFNSTDEVPDNELPR